MLHYSLDNQTRWVNQVRPLFYLCILPTILQNKKISSAVVGSLHTFGLKLRNLGLLTTTFPAAFTTMVISLGADSPSLSIPSSRLSTSSLFSSRNFQIAFSKIACCSLVNASRIIPPCRIIPYIPSHSYTALL